MLVDIDSDGLLALLDGHADDLVAETAGCDRGLCLLLRRGGERVLVLAAHLVLVRDVLGGVAHVAVLEGAPEAIADHLVDELAVTDPVAISRALDEVWRARHVLHPAGQDHLAVAGSDRLGGKRDRLEPRAAHLVHGHRRRALGQPGAESSLPRRVLPQPGGEHVAHEHLVDGVQPGAAQCLLHRHCPELRSGDVDEYTTYGADGGAHSADDDGVLHAEDCSSKRPSGPSLAGYVSAAPNSLAYRAANSSRV